MRTLRSPKQERSAFEHQGVSIEKEPDGKGGEVVCATVFLTGAECKFTCSMCDLWQYTLHGPTPAGAISHQLEAALSTIDQSANVRWIKLYNASNFFDESSVPKSDLERVAELCSPFERIIIENHPAMFRSEAVRTRAIEFQSGLAGTLEVAVGLETIEPLAMALLNKRMSLEDFSKGVAFLRKHSIASRAFVLLQPPGVDPENATDSSLAACSFAFECGVRHCSVIPTRAHGSWLGGLVASGQWSPPSSQQVEMLVERWLGDLGGEQAVNDRPVMVVDLWDWDLLSGTCDRCSKSRRERLQRVNILQRSIAPVASECSCCPR